MHAQQGDPRSVRIEDDIVRGIERRDLAVGGIPFGVVFEIFRDGLPAADVIPIEAGFHHQDAIGFLHDRVIERDSRQISETFREGCLEIVARAHPGDETGKLWRVAIEFAQDRRDRPDEHARVPSEISFAQKRFCQIRIRFFPKADHAMNCGLVVHAAKLHGFALLDVTIPWAGPGRLDADRNQRASFFRRRRRGCSKFFGMPPLSSMT